MENNTSRYLDDSRHTAYLCLPRASSLDAGDVMVHHPDWKLTTCPLCGAACYTSPEREETLRANRNLIGCCTLCALKQGL